MNKQTVYDLKPEGKTVYVRVDYNVPHDKDGHILDDRRIRATIPTIRYLLDKGARWCWQVIWGAPRERWSGCVPCSLCQTAVRTALSQEVLFADDCVGEEHWP